MGLAVLRGVGFRRRNGSRVGSGARIDDASRKGVLAGAAFDDGLGEFFVTRFAVVEPPAGFFGFALKCGNVSLLSQRGGIARIRVLFSG
jgi:hypothetical protein